jgi:quercetin dioxygenase-like cupin family protein
MSTNDNEPGNEAEPGPGHNSEKPVVWDAWQTKRVFVRALEGTYSHLTKELLDQPRVYSSRDLPWKGGPQHFGKFVISPQKNRVTQSIETHIEAFGPGGFGQKHGHLNSACFFIIRGSGHDIHDGRRIEWKAGDIMLVENGCVHQHFADSEEGALILVFKAKPLFLFMHLLFQKVVDYPPTTRLKGHEDWAPTDEF